MKKPMTVNLDDGELQSLEDESKDTGRSVSSIIREAVKQYFQRKGKEVKHT
jgi:predicted DNA-binding protein